MASYRLLAEWAERDQRRIDARRARPQRIPGTEPLAVRILSGFFGTVATIVKLITIPAMTIWTVTLIAQHTVRSLLLALAFAMILGFSIFTTGMLVQARRGNGRNMVTGLARKR